VRGIHTLIDLLNDGGGITPACAGNTLVIFSASDIFWDHPRLCGEYEVRFALELSGLGSPPLVRGIRSALCAGAFWTGITPACAGNTRTCSRVRKMNRDHPRLCGEYTPDDGYALREWGSPPLVRGIHPVDDY